MSKRNGYQNRLLLRIFMRSHSIRVKLSDKAIYTAPLQGVRGRTQRLPVLVNALVEVYAGLAHVRAFSPHPGKEHQT